jgi:hypothetical protein
MLLLSQKFRKVQLAFLFDEHLAIEIQLKTFYLAKDNK